LRFVPDYFAPCPELMLIQRPSFYLSRITALLLYPYRSFGIGNVRIGAITPRWPTTALFNSGTTEGWAGSGAGITSCGISGVILGGAPDAAGNILTRSKSCVWERIGRYVCWKGVGSWTSTASENCGFRLSQPDFAVHFLPRSSALAYEYLPSHAGLRLQLRLFYLDAWPAGANVMIHIDGRLVYKAGQPSGATTMHVLRMDGQEAFSYAHGRSSYPLPHLYSSPPFTLI
jgi:hypothetical protein